VNRNSQHNKIRDYQTYNIKYIACRPMLYNAYIIYSQALSASVSLLWLFLTRCRAGRTPRCRCKFRYVSKFTVASRGFHRDSNAFELNNNINHGKMTVLNISVYCLWIHYLTHIVGAINIISATVQNAEIVHSTTLCKIIMLSMMNDRFHCNNCAVKCSAFLSSFGTKISHVSFFSSKLT